MTPAEDAPGAPLAAVRAALAKIALEPATGPATGPVPGPVGVAVSGGGDSVALLFLLRDCLPPDRLRVATVDHGLRPGSAGEAAQVAATCARLGLAHDTLRWTGWDGRGNLQDAARRARLRLLTDWARRHGLAALALGHTVEDQAETVLMRLARSAGVAGLAAMPAAYARDGLTVFRPLLGVERTALRIELVARGEAWIEDPSNADTRFDRVRLRKAAPALAELGLTAQALANVADNMARAEAALAAQTAQAVARLRQEDGDLFLPDALLKDLPEDILRRLVAAGVTWITGAAYPPRRAPLLAALADLRAGRRVALAGCRLLPGRGGVRICRDAWALREARAAVGQVWDGRWILTPPAGTEPDPGLQVGVLGRDGLAQCPHWRDSGRPQAAVMATPAVWSGGRLVSAPLAGRAQGWQARLCSGRDLFTLGLLTH